MKTQHWIILVAIDVVLAILLMLYLGVVGKFILYLAIASVAITTLWGLKAILWLLITSINEYRQ